MRMQCGSCRELHLCDPDEDEFTRQPVRLRFIDLLRGRDDGCTGCRLICEVLPLLNDYCTGLRGISRLFVHSVGRRLTIESLITLRNGSWQLMWVGSFELCKIGDESVPWTFVQDDIEIPLHRDLEPGSQEAYKLIERWYTTCRKEHDVCNARSQTEGPRRLLYIDPESPGSLDTVRLVECDVTSPPDYITLSHAWGLGKHRPLETVGDNVKQHMTEIKIDALSRTFRDAIAVCRRLGERFLWIDSLCIIQDDDGDKAREIPRMHEIYGGAVLTISAMSAHDGRGGCWIPRKRVFDLPLENGRSTSLAFHRSLKPDFQHTSFVGSQFDTEYDAELDTQYPLATRKWALQERVLSRRILHFTAQCLLWECQYGDDGARCACGTLDISYSDNTKQNVYKAMTEEDVDDFYVTFDQVRGPPCAFHVVFHWMALVIAFSHAHLSNETDVLPALAGLASAFSKKDLGTYCAGLWEASLPVALCWYTSQVDSNEATHSRPTQFVAPTWSWASVQGAIRFDALDNVDSDPVNLIPVAFVRSITCEATSQNEFGHVQSGSRLSIMAPGCILPPKSIAATTISGFERAEFMVDTLKDIPLERECVVALIFTKERDGSQALVLVANADRTYRRCGLIRFWDNPVQVLNHFPKWMDFEII